MENMRQAFSDVDYEKQGLIKCKDAIQALAELEVYPDEDEFQELLAGLNASYDTSISFAEFVDIRALFT